MKCKYCGSEIPKIKSKTVIHDGKEYTIEDEQEGRKYSEIVVPKGWKLWEPEDVVRLHKDEKLRKKLNLNDCWFFVESKYYLPKYVARFFANSGRVFLICDWDPVSSNSSLGVRFRSRFSRR